MSNAGFTDLKLFLQPSFDANEYTSRLIATSNDNNAAASTTVVVSHDLSAASALPTTPSAAQESKPEVDLSLAISRLNLAIDQLTSCISAKVSDNASALLQRTTRVSAMQSGLSHTSQGIDALQTHIDRLSIKVHQPIARLQSAQIEVVRYDQAADLVARTAKFVTVARRLETQMNVLFSAKSADKTAGKKQAGEGTVADEDDEAVIGVVHGRDLARAALTIKDISTLLERENALFDAAVAAHATTTHAQDETACSILELELVKQTLPAVERAQKTVTDYMEDMVVRGLRDLSPTMLSSALQTAFNLDTLASLVKDLLYDLTEVVKERITAAFDVDALSRSLNMRTPTIPTQPAYTTSYKSWSARNHDPADSTAQDAQWTSAFWKRLETMIVLEMGAVCSKVYTLEKVLRLKTDSESGVNFLQVALQVLDNAPSVAFWRTFAVNFRTHTDRASAKSPFLAQALTSATDSAGGYLKLLRIFHAFFAKVAGYTDVVYDEGRQSPDVVEFVHTALDGLQQAYLDKAVQRFSQPLEHMLHSNTGDTTEAETVVRLATNLVDSNRFDPLLVKATQMRLTTTLQSLTTKHRQGSPAHPFAAKLQSDLRAIGIAMET